MAQYLKIPLQSPFKFYKQLADPGIHFDDNWFYHQIKPFEVKKQYFQKWEKQNTTKLQVRSTILPSKVVAYNLQQQPIADFLWTDVATGAAGEKVYECIVDFTAVTINQYWKDNIYFLAFEATLLSIDWRYISEPIWLKAEGGWPNTQLIQYWSDGNDLGPVFTTGYKPYFRVECGITDFQPGRERSSFTDQLHDVETLSAMPYREYKLSVGHKDGVPPWVMDLMNRIFCCKVVKIAGKQYETTDGSKWDIARQKGYPMIWGSIDITEAVNMLSLEDTAESIYPGIVIGYNYETGGFFGGANNVIGVQDEEIIN